MACSTRPIPHSCDLCSEFAVLKVSTNPRDTENEVRAFLGMRVKQPDETYQSLFDTMCLFDIDFDHVVEASNAGCKLSIFLVKLATATKTLDGKRFMLGVKFTSFYLDAKWVHFGAFYEDFPQRDDIPSWMQRGEIDQESYFARSFVNFVEFEGGRYSAVTSHGHPLLQHFGMLDVNYVPGSSLAFQQAREWMSTCSKDHCCCRLRNMEPMPTRLLKIEKEHDRLQVRLCSSKQSGASSYAALSYCWGRDQSVKTTRRNVTLHEQGIDTNVLPPTLQDAIVVAKELGLEYLWIDALCIVQDDDSSKAVEISRMDSIYAGATVTIAATRACGVYEGFLGPRSYQPIDPSCPVFELPYRLPDKNTGTVVLIPDFVSGEEPLDKRAWTYQERLLSPRILDFGTINTRWICQASTATLHRFNFTDGWQNLAVFNSLRNDTQQKEMALAEGWDSIVQRYTRRTIGFPTDRLEALAGIAKTYSAVLKDEYRAGLWRSDIAHRLLWRRTERWKADSKKGPYIAPSWSWASLNAWVQLGRTTHLDENFEVLDCKVDLRHSSSPYGAVTGGFLRVKGSTITTTWKRVLDGDYPTDVIKIHGKKLKSSFKAQFSPDSHPDDLKQAPEEGFPVLLLVVSTRDRRTSGSGCRCPNKGSVGGLVLAEVRYGVYERHGCFSFPSMDMDIYQECMEVIREGGVQEVMII